MSRVLLINPDYFDALYPREAKACSAMFRGNIPLSLLYMASPLISDDHEVKILDLNSADNPDEYLYNQLNAFQPDFVGITASTPCIKRVYALTDVIKDFNNKITVVVGGPHPSALPEDVLKESRVDCVVKGEGDFVLQRIVREGLSEQIPNIYFKNNGSIVKAKEQGYITEDLDELPYPAYHLIDLKKYVRSDILVKKQPVGFIEISRGCYGRCIYCNKRIFGFKLRHKSPKRSVNEIEMMLKLGFREIHIIDDIFTADKKRVIAFCEEIEKRGLKFPWLPVNGVRVDSVDLDLLKIMKRSGCYAIAYGVESGSQRVLDVVNKRITLSQVENSVHWAKEAKMEVCLYLMLALPTESQTDMQKTIDFAIKLSPDIAKWSIATPLPGTPLFDRMLKNGQIKSLDWERYIFHGFPKTIYDHDVLSWDVIETYYYRAYKKFYLNPYYISKMILRIFIRMISNGSMFSYIKILLRIRN